MNGGLKSLLSLWENLARNRRYTRYVTDRDIFHIRSRVEHEGVTFLTSVLPKFGKAIDLFHGTNTWNPPENFKTSSDGRPFFLGLAFDLVKKGDSQAVDCVRQLTYMFYKLEIPYEETTIQTTLRQFVDTDDSLSDIDDLSHVYSETLHLFLDPVKIVDRMASLIHTVLLYEDPYDIIPSHGSGATACRTPNHDKYHKLRYYPKLDECFSYSDYFFYSYTHVSDEYEKLAMSPVMEPRARICIVPKDSRGPRIISCEPAELLYIQQGLMKKLYKAIESHPLTRGQVIFTDQSVNQLLAKLGSQTGYFSTIDLKDASDRVSLDLIERVFPADWVECLKACRSEETVLPDGRVVKLRKFAPMGSSCCFPVEALVFWACAIATKQLYLGNNNPVNVYGDDIICLSSDYWTVVDGLKTVNFIVNESKSYSAGPFRESCGCEYHNGYDVTPVRLRKIPTDAGTGLQEACDFINNLVEKFGYDDSLLAIDLVENLVSYHFPRSLHPLPLTVRVEPKASNDVFFKRRFNKSLQRFEHRILSLKRSVLTKRLPDWGELVRFELSKQIVTYNQDLDVSFLDYSVQEGRLEPGQYTDHHSVHKSWQWAWLG